MAGKTVPQPIVPPSEPEFQMPGPSPYTDPNPSPHPTYPTSPIASFTDTAQNEKPATNTDIVTSATPPINHFSQTEYGQQQSNAIAPPISRSPFYNSPMQSTAADKPQDYLSPEARKMVGYGSSALGGIAAGSQVAPTANAGDAALQVLGSGLGGAAAGLATGNPIGAAIGGIAGLVTGGINAWVGTSSARKQQRAQDKIRRDIQARDEARYQQARQDQERYYNIERGDSMEKERYNRRQTALQSQWAAHDQARNALNDSIAQDASFKHMIMGDLR